jgi:hypothetical protein
LIVTAILHYRQGADVKRLLVSLTAAAVALVSGVAILVVIVVCALLPTDGFRGATAGTVADAYAASLLSVPAGVGWGWALSVWRPGMMNGRSFAVGLGLFVFATCASAMASLAEGLARYGHNYAIDFPGLSAVFVFLGAVMLLAIRLVWRDRRDGMVPALRSIGAAFRDALMLALGVYAIALAAYSLLIGAGPLVEAWNVLIFFYPIYLIGSVGLAGALLFYGGRFFARTWSRLRA